METEMTNELKRKFFAQYYGQSVFSRKSYTQEGTRTEVVGGLLDTDISDAFLLLKPLSSITDEDAIEVSRMDISIDKETHNFINPPGNHEKEIAYTKNNIYFLMDKTKIADYLRSKSYALPFMGIPVEQQVKSGWVKLITDK